MKKGKSAVRARASCCWRIIVACILVSLAPQVAWTQNGPLFRFTETPGRYSVGMTVVEQYDYSRVYRHATDGMGVPYRGERARPLQTLVWYPSVQNHGQSMTVRDYANLLAAETSFDNPRMTRVAEKLIAGLAPTLAMHLWAIRDAAPVVGHFPVVVYAPSFSASSWENADLCEYLASHGYVVFASPNLGAMSREMTLDIAGVDAQARDISFLIGYAHTWKNTDMSHVAVVGFSWGGLSNLFAAARDNRIDALVSLDGTARYRPGLVNRVGDVHPEQMTIPQLYFAQGSWTLEDQAHYLSKEDLAGPNVLDAWRHGDLIMVRMLGMIHQENSAMQQRNEDMWREYYRWQRADYDRADGMVGYALIARYTLRFLDGYLKGNQEAIAFLKRTPAENGAPKHFMTASFRSAARGVVTLDQFRAQLAKRGFQHAAEIYAAAQVDNSGLKLDDSTLTSWAEELRDGNHLPQATAVLALDARLHPDSSMAYARLGEAYEASGQKILAISSYRSSLEKDPSNDATRRKLEELEGNATQVR